MGIRFSDSRILKKGKSSRNLFILGQEPKTRLVSDRDQFFDCFQPRVSEHLTHGLTKQ